MILPRDWMLDEMAVKIHGALYKRWTTDRVTKRKSATIVGPTSFRILTPSHRRDVMNLVIALLAATESYSGEKNEAPKSEQ